MTRSLLALCLATAAAFSATAGRLPVRATFTVDSSEHRWALADLDPQLPADWTPYDFLVLEFRASSPQRFDLGIETAQRRVAKRIGPMPGVWVRAAIPLRFYREPAGSAGDLAATYNQPRGSYWINIHSDAVGPTTGVRAITVSMPNPVGSPTLEIRSVSLAKSDPGDAVLEGKPVIDELGQYAHADWPGKARTLEDLRKAWASEDRATTAFPGRCAYGGFEKTSVRATGYFRVERVDGKWWFVDPDGHLFLSMGVNGVGTGSGTRVQGREDLFAALPPAQLGPAARGASFYTWNLQRRYGDNWRPLWAEAAARRLADWGLNSIHYWGPRGGQPGAEEPRVSYAQMLRWQLGPTIMGMPDVYAEDFARRVDEAAAAQLDARSRDPWMLGYFIGNEPPWPGREAQLIDLLLAAPPSEMQARAKAHLAGGDTPERRKAFVHTAFSRYLDTINAAVRKHAPNHLHLGIRFGGDPHEDIVNAARGFDVFSMNIYRYAPPRTTLDRVYQLTGRPMLIGEFHIGVPERGLAPGLVQAASQEERGIAYRYYVEQAMAHPAMIGTHWFQWLDQPATGRNDGENYNIGFVDVTDRPYAELVAAARATHARLLDVHRGVTPPLDRAPKPR